MDTTSPAPEDSDDSAPVRHRYGNLLEESRIARAGGGPVRLSPFYQALLYLVMLGALAAAVYWSWIS
jgi:hypothetical protein